MLNVIADTNESLVFAIAADAAIGAHAAVLNELAESFGHDDPHPPGREPPDWRRTVRSVLSLARANGIGAEAFVVSAERSEQSFTALLPPAAAGAETLDAALAAAVAVAMAAIPAMPSATANNGGLPALRAAHARLSRGERLTWSAWAALTKVKCAPTKDGRSYADALAQVAAAAGRHGEHPRLRSDGARFIREIFLCATEALQAYQTHKAERGLVDFTDQEALALQVLQDPALSARLRERISGGPQVEHGEDPPVDAVRWRVQAAATSEDATARPKTEPIPFSHSIASLFPSRLPVSLSTGCRSVHRGPRSVRDGDGTGEEGRTLLGSGRFVRQ